MTDKHTPKPWLIDYDCGDTHINSFDGDPIAVIESDSVNIRANAALIARAPELLAENDALWSNLVSLLLHETGVEADDFPMSVDCAFETLKNEFNQRASDRDRLKERIAELEAERKWRPIETAPRDGALILGMRYSVDTDGEISNWVAPIFFEDGSWVHAWEECYEKMPRSTPTLWMPLPKMEDN